MPKYDIPLSTIYEEGEGQRVLIDDRSYGPAMTLVDRTGDTPHDVIQLHDSDIEELAHIILAYLNQDNTGTLGGSPTGCSFDEYRTDTVEDDD